MKLEINKINSIITPILNGHYTEADIEKIENEILKIAISDDVEAQYLMVLIQSFRNRKSEVNDELLWTYLAAQNGCGDAQYEMGLFFLYDENDMCRRDALLEAVKWLEKAAYNGNIVAIDKLVNLYQMGTKIKRNVVRAIYWKSYKVNKVKNIPIVMNKDFLFESEEKQESYYRKEQISYECAVGKIWDTEYAMDYLGHKLVSDKINKLLSFGCKANEILVICNTEETILKDNVMEKIKHRVFVLKEVIDSLLASKLFDVDNFKDDLTKEYIKGLSVADKIVLLSTRYIGNYWNYDEVKYVFVDGYNDYNNEQKIFIMNFVRQLRENYISVGIFFDSMDRFKFDCENTAGLCVDDGMEKKFFCKMKNYSVKK